MPRKARSVPVSNSGETYFLSVLPVFAVSVTAELLLKKSGACSLTNWLWSHPNGSYAFLVVGTGRIMAIRKLGPIKIRTHRCHMT